MSAKKIMVGFLIGTALGAVLGIMYSPDKCTVTKRRISKKGQDYAGDLEEKLNNLIDEITEQFNLLVVEATLMAKETKPDKQNPKNNKLP